MEHFRWRLRPKCILVTPERPWFGFQNSRKATLMPTLWCKTDINWGWRCHRQTKTQSTVCSAVRSCSFGTSKDEFIRDKFFFCLTTEEHVHCAANTYSSKRSKNLRVSVDPDLETNPMQSASSLAANSNIPGTYAMLQEILQLLPQDESLYKRLSTSCQRLKNFKT